MNGNGETELHQISGEIVEIYEKDKSRFAKIKYDQGFIDICINKISDAHLNDKIIINSNIWIKSIIQKVEEN